MVPHQDLPDVGAGAKGGVDSETAKRTADAEERVKDEPSALAFIVQLMLLGKMRHVPPKSVKRLRRSCWPIRKRSPST